MIDIETGSTESNAAIFSVAAIGFRPESHRVTPEHSFYIEISHEQPRHISPDTMAWWASQPKPPPQSDTKLHEALQLFIAWLPPQVEAVWANSPSFDLTILKHACKQYNLLWPYPFWCERDVRTIKALTFPGHTLGNTHNAYEDAVRQALLICDIYKYLYQQTPLPNPWSYQPT